MLVSEFMNSGTLESFLKKLGDQSPSEVNWQLLVDLCLDIAIVIQHLSSLPEVISHGDLAARNILLHRNENGEIHAKLADFGLAVSGKSNPSCSLMSVEQSDVPYRWAAPEAFSGTRSTKSDVYSFATVLWEVFSLGLVPWGNNSPSNVYQEISNPNGRRLERPRFCSEEIYQLMLRCWDSDRSGRPKIDQVITELQHHKQFLHTGDQAQNYVNIQQSTTIYSPSYLNFTSQLNQVQPQKFGRPSGYYASEMKNGNVTQIPSYAQSSYQPTQNINTQSPTLSNSNVKQTTSQSPKTTAKPNSSRAANRARLSSIKGTDISVKKKKSLFGSKK